MKKILPHSIILFLFCFHGILFGQTLVNQVMQDTTGSPTLNFPFQAACKTSDNGVVIVGNTYSTTSGSNLLVSKYSSTGAMLWQFQYGVSADSGGVYGVDVFALGSYVYVAGAITGPFNVDAILKITSDSGQIVWVQGFGAVNYVVPSKIVADSSGNVYVASTAEITTGESAMVITKFNGSGTQLWVHAYDTTGMYSGATAIALPTDGDTDITVTGFSGTGFGSWNFLTGYFGISTGSLMSTKLTTNGDGSFSSPAGVGKDYQDRVYIAGTAAYNGSNTDVKTIAFDSVYNQRWVADYGNADSLADSASRMTMDADANILITGYTTASNNAKQLLVLKYSNGGSLLWSRTVAAPNNPAYNCAGNSITSDDSLNVYVTGYFYNGATNNNDFISIAFDKNGNTIWEKSYDGGGTNDVANDIVVNNNDVFVSGVSSHDTTATYLTIEYQQLTLSKTAAINANGNPVYLTGQIIIKVDSSAVIRSAVDNSKIQFGSLSTYLNPWMVDSINAHLPTGTTCQLAKMFMNLKTTDTISISRLGQRVPIPDFWSTFVLTYTYTTEMGLTRSSSLSESALCADLNQLFPLVQNTELDRVATLTSSTTPNDMYYEPSVYNTDPTKLQFSLHQNTTYPGSDIDVEPAWAYSTGQPYIKVGTVDDGLLLLHSDFQIYPHTYSANTISIAKGGWDFIANDSLQRNLYSDFGEGHGTMVGGVIGAVRNNQLGVAGIAGGNDTVPGVSLYGFRIFDAGSDDVLTEIATAHKLAEAIVEIATQTPDSSYGWGMDIMNNSYALPHLNTFLEIDTVGDTTGYYIDSNWSTITDAYHYANRNQAVQPASAGNGPNEDGVLTLVYPAVLDSIWMIITGGTNVEGTYMGDNPQDYTDGGPACIGAGMDIAAPYDNNLVYTTQVNDADTGGVFGHFDGTSSAAAHVSGVAALLLSYMNDIIPDYRNLAPEDVEYMMERSATDVDAPGYDTLTGWGRLNAGGALSMADTSKRKLHHFDSNSFGITNTISLVNGGTNVWLTERARNNNNTGQVFAPQKYAANIYKVTCTMSLPFSSADTLAAFWGRCSSSFTYPYFNNESELIPHERIFINTLSPTSTTITRYIYQLLDTLTDTVIGWLPMDTTQAKSANFAISIMVGDSIHTPIDSIPTQITTVKTENSQLSIYPNPATDNAMIAAATNCQGNVKIVMYDMEGVEIRSIFNGDLGETTQNFRCNTSDLSAGMYFVSMQTDCETQSLKFAKF